ncbi:hypothetical protein [Vibrio owensii]|uniref:hypothetical protein n=1 Tax=Vibrio owensii TaxID=696485 RepID=UPI0022DD49E0|nr:hypothetical protein [Vibrio owensii]MDA0383557.1 hypothetical protein [Vibrio owensii]
MKELIIKQPNQLGAILDYHGSKAELLSLSLIKPEVLLYFTTVPLHLYKSPNRMTEHAMGRSTPTLQINLDCKTSLPCGKDETHIRSLSKETTLFSDNTLDHIICVDSQNNWPASVSNMIPICSKIHVTRFNAIEAMYPLKTYFFSKYDETTEEKIAKEFEKIRIKEDSKRTINVTIDHEWKKAEMLASVVQKLSESDKIDALIDWAISQEETAFENFRSVLKETQASEEQFAAAKVLNDIESRVSEYPMCSVATAAKLLGEVTTKNPSRVIATARKENKIFAFTFGSAKNIQVPFFQFNTKKLGVYEPVPELCRILSGLNDWGVYQWLTTHSADLETAPAVALKHESLWDDLLLLAGLFKSQNTYRDLSFTAAEVGNDN